MGDQESMNINYLCVFSFFPWRLGIVRMFLVGKGKVEEGRG